MSDQSPTCPIVTRRQFITGLGAAVSLGVAGGYGLGLWRKDPGVTNPVTATPATTAPTTLPIGSIGQSMAERTLVILEMGGGNDGLSMVVPHANDRYYDLRSSTAIGDPLELDNEIGLHPALVGLAARYEAGQVALIEGVGYPDPDLSHFVSMETWWTAHASGPTASGWLGRYLDAAAGPRQPLAGISIGPGPSRAMLGDTSFSVSIQDASGLSPAVAPWIDDVDELMGAWSGFAQAGPDEDPKLAPLRFAIASAAQARDQLAAAIGGEMEAGGRRRGRARVENFMGLAAQLVVALEEPSVIYVHGWGDFDTHQGQLNRHGDLMSQLDAALDGFWTTLDDAGAMEDVAVLTTSEFGRRALDNGSGTDHGTAGTQLLMGPGVRGGRYGEPPSLASLDPAGNVTHTVDFRSAYATVLDGWLGVDADTVLGGTFERLDVYV